MRKTEFCKITMFLFIFCIIVISIFKLDSVTVYAKPYPTTKKEVETDIKKLSYEVANLKKKYKQEKKLYNKQSKGSTPILAGQVVSYSPYIVKDSFLGTTYYHITNPDMLPSLLGFVSGSVKKTNKYTNYFLNGYPITCVVCKAVKVTARPMAIMMQLDDKKKELEKAKNTLKAKVEIYSKKINVGDKKEVDYDFSKWGYDQKIKWYSSNENILKINSKGVMNAIALGEVKITAVAEISGKKLLRK